MVQKMAPLMHADKIPSSPAQAIKNCMYASVTSCECERSDSALCRLIKQLRASDDGQGSFVLSRSSACTL